MAAVPFRPAPFTTLIAAVGVVILVNLGLWQLRRHDEASLQLAVVDAHRKAPPATAADLAQPADDLAWRDAVLTGHYTGESRFLVTAFDGGQTGFDVVEPFAVDGGPVLLVDRGFVPSDAWATSQDAIRVMGTVTVEGLLLPITGRTDLVPLPADAEHPERWPMELEHARGCDHVVGPPLGTLAARAGDVAPVYLTLGPDLGDEGRRTGSSLPRSGYHAVPKQIGHLQYAVQWFLIASVLIGVWIGGALQRGRSSATGVQPGRR